jgi:hypothetical protein
MIAFADQDLVVIPAQDLTADPVTPPDNGAARTRGSKGQCLEQQDLNHRGRRRSSG